MQKSIFHFAFIWLGWVALPGCRNDVSPQEKGLVGTTGTISPAASDTMGNGILLTPVSVSPTESGSTLPQSSESFISAMEDTCEAILKRLCIAAGIPEEMTPFIDLDDAPNLSALYEPGKPGVIYIGTKTIKACLALGEHRWRSALAFIIAHEIKHALQNRADPYLFSGESNHCLLTTGENLNSDSMVEDSADWCGAFWAHLAGFPLEHVLPDLMKSLYDEFDLTGKQLPGYAPLEERMATAEKTEKKGRELARIFETAAYWSGCGFYEDAAAAYQYVLDIYDGKEIRLNLGANLALQALYLPKQFQKNDSLVWHFEQDPETRLQSFLPPGEMGGGAAERAKLLDDAEFHVRKALKIDPEYTPARLSLMTILAIQSGESEAAPEFQEVSRILQTFELGYRQAMISKSDHEKARLNWATTCAKILSRKREAMELLDSLSHSPVGPVSKWATYNFEVLHRADSTKFTQSDNLAIPLFFIKEASAFLHVKNTISQASLFAKSKKLVFRYGSLPDSSLIAWGGRVNQSQIGVRRFTASPQARAAAKALAKSREGRKIIVQKLKEEGSFVGFWFDSLGVLKEWALISRKN